ncbi:MAG: DNA repair protein RadA [Candidatus Eisenbacteria bacterium]|nr:DNA repair protein RadA [Candidatus Eisenbacteria bacterium]
MPKASKTKTIFICQNCGSESPKWFGRCTDCGEWNTAVAEERIEGKTRWTPLEERERGKPVRLLDVEDRVTERYATGVDEFDRTLGGGIVPGAVVLVGGDPGIGKSTLLLQVLVRLVENDFKTLYVSGEESASQTKLRAERLGPIPGELLFACETDISQVLHYIKDVGPQVVVIDSIQTMYKSEIPSAPGSVSQVRECALELLNYAKGSDVSVLLVGHVTKDGIVAGPRVLEHMVDAVLYLEGERHHNYRILRAAKNRFGSTNEIGIFEMREEGMVEVINPSGVFLKERPLGLSGSVVVASIEGTRPMLIELQALVTRTAYNYPQRVATGFELRRLSLLLAVIEKRAGLHLSGSDVFFNVAGGMSTEEPGVDLGVVLSVSSSFKNKAIEDGIVAIGEVGLGGEVRGVTHVERRVVEAERLGFKECIIPKNNLSSIKGFGKGNIKVTGVSSILEALERIL